MSVASVGGRKALEVVVCLEDSIVEVIHLREPGQVRAGAAPGCRVALPAEALGGAESVVLASLDATGQAYVARDLGTASGLRPLGDGENASLDSGGVRVFTRWVPDTTVSARAGLRIEGRIATAVVAALVAHLCFLGLLRAIPPDPKGLAWDNYKESPNRYVVVSSKAKEDPLLKMPELGRSSAGQSGDAAAAPDGAAQSGPQGKMGRPDAAARDGRTALRGKMPEDRPGPGDAHAYVRDKGVLGVMRQVDWAPVTGADQDEWGSHDEYAYGPSAGGAPGDGQGNWGGGYDGNGAGGCPPGAVYCVDGSYRTGRLPTMGGGPGGPGYDPKATGGGVKLGPKKDNTPKVHFDPATVHDGGLDKAIVKRVVQSHHESIGYCYQKELQVNENLAGTVTVEFVINPNGQVISVIAAENTVSQAVGGCVTGVVHGMQFPKSDGITKVKYPFTFRQVGQ